MIEHPDKKVTLEFNEFYISFSEADITGTLSIISAKSHNKASSLLTRCKEDYEYLLSFLKNIGFTKPLVYTPIKNGFHVSVYEETLYGTRAEQIKHVLECIGLNEN